MTTVQIQHLLCYLGYDTGGVDGILGPKTKAAVYDFQADYKDLEADGLPGRMTQAALQKAVGSGWTRPQNVSSVDTQAKPSIGDFWADIKYFTRDEFRCRCGQYHAPYCNGFPAEPDETLVRLADRVRAHFSAKAHPTSGLRCKQHNADQPNAAANSKHLYGKALDFWIEGVSGSQLLAYVKDQPQTNYAYIVSGNIIHMDVN